MLEEYYRSAYALARLRVPPLGPHLDQHVECMSQQGYSAETIRAHLTILRRFNLWLAIRRRPISRFDETDMTAFARDQAAVYHSAIDREPTRLLLERLRTLGVNTSSPPRPTITPAQRVVTAFIGYLREERGFSEQTILYCALFARRFLSRPSATRRTPLSRLRPKDVVDFVRQLPRGKGSRLSTAMTALRVFLRYLHHVGRTNRDLSVYVPAVARWRLQSVPVTLSMKDLRLLLRQCDRRTARGRRDYAVLLLLSRLALRSGEVQRLTLDDFDWVRGEVKILGKGRRHAVLPLPADVGLAVAAYLEQDRPACPTRHVFVRDRAPFVKWSDASAVCSLVRRAFRRAALRYPRMGPHLLRHTCATHLLHRGRSMEEIQQVLRHTHVDSTATYAKVNLPDLRQAAASWPGGRQ